MGRIAKKKDKPAASDKHGKYITRSMAVRRLQISIAQFRKLCILKGIYPRDPTNKNKGTGQTYYLYKDIQFLSHDPMLDKMRLHKTWKKRVVRAKGRKEMEKVKRLQSVKPQLEVDHVIRERYPTFQDALRDMDDALCMLFLYSALPASRKAPLKAVLLARRLILEFQSWVMHTRSLRKVFISIKGIYYQAEISGVPVTWLVPHAFALEIPDDVDFKVLLSFVKLYETLCGFVNYRLYYQAGLHYPPVFDTDLEESGESLYAVIVDANAREEAAPSELAAAAEHTESAPSSNRRLPSNFDAKVSAIARRDEGEGEEEAAAAMDVEENGDEFLEDADEAAAATRPVKREKPVGELFRSLKFFVSREVPRDALQFIIQCCGGQVSWEGEHAPYPSNDQSITHHVVDRPVQTHRYLSREYVQPQWVFDCVNARFLLPVDEYLPGQALPPHLSPFVDLEKTNYIPQRAHEIRALKEGKTLEELRTERDGEMEEEESDVEEDEYEDDDEEEAEARYEAELEAERKGITFSAKKKGKGASDAAASGAEGDAKKPKKKTKKELAEELKKEEEEQRNKLRSIMIEKKKHRKLYNKVKRVQRHSEQSRQRLEKKAAAFESAQKEAKKGRAKRP